MKKGNPKDREDLAQWVATAACSEAHPGATKHDVALIAAKMMLTIDSLMDDIATNGGQQCSSSNHPGQSATAAATNSLTGQGLEPAR